MRKLRMGLLGGGEGAFIGAVHRAAAELDGEIELVCGAFSSDPERSRRSGEQLYRLPAARCYGSAAELFAGEAALPAEQRMQFVTIATPNDSHLPLASAALAAGFDVVCDKPATCDLAEARVLARRVAASGRLFAVTYNYTGYPLVREARAVVARGELGPLRRVVVEYLQGWLATDVDAKGQKQAAWRTDPARAGAAGAMGDIGSHAENLVSYVTGLRIESLCADLAACVPGRRLDDDASVLLRFAGGARGALLVSQIAVGEENNLRLRVYGERGSLDWSQQQPNDLLLRWLDRPMEVRRTAGPGIGADATAGTRLPSGHPEGFLEAFANIYRGVAAAIRARENGEAARGNYPTIDDAVRGMAFIDAVVESSRCGSVWLPVAQS